MGGRGEAFERAERERPNLVSLLRKLEKGVNSSKQWHKPCTLPPPPEERNDYITLY